METLQQAVPSFSTGSLPKKGRGWRTGEHFWNWEDSSRLNGSSMATWSGSPKQASTSLGLSISCLSCTFWHLPICAPGSWLKNLVWVRQPFYSALFYFMANKFNATKLSLNCLASLTFPCPIVLPSHKLPQSCLPLSVVGSMGLGCTLSELSTYQVVFQANNKKQIFLSRVGVSLLPWMRCLSHRINAQ